MRFLLLLYLALLSLCVAKKQIESLDMDEYSIVTLVSGTDIGYVSGAIALGQSLIDSSSKIPKLAMVTSEVSQESRKRMSRVGWVVKEVETILCNHQNNLPEGEYDMSGEQYQAGIKRWSTTCTKFQAFNPQTYITIINNDDDSFKTKKSKKNNKRFKSNKEKKRVIFMDSDMLVLNNIDALLINETYRDTLNLNTYPASFAAAPEGFPPDTFNAGFMLFTPSDGIFNKLLQLNEEVGSTEGGDQGILNYGLCPRWFLGPASVPSLPNPEGINGGEEDDYYHCSRLPWIYNVEAAHIGEYNTLRTMSSQPTSAVVHFVSDGKPWQVILFEYYPEHRSTVSLDVKKKLGAQALMHAKWRDAYFRGSGEQPVKNEFLIECVQLVQGSRSGHESEKSSDDGDGGGGEAKAKAKAKATVKGEENGRNKGKKKVRLLKRKKDKTTGKKRSVGTRITNEL